MIRKLKAKARELKKHLTLLGKAAKDPRVPWHAKLLAGLTVLYALSPIDLIPDWIPILGLLDDIVIVPLGIYLSVRAIPKEILARLEQELEEAEKQPSPEKEETPEDSPEPESSVLPEPASSVLPEPAPISGNDTPPASDTLNYEENPEQVSEVFRKEDHN